MNPHATLLKFGYPDSAVFSTAHWCVMLRPAQATLGALVLCATSEHHALADLPVEAFMELKTCTGQIAAALNAFQTPDKINYLALMMVDPHVHFHVLPRYQHTKTFDGIAFPDQGWPGMPNLATSPTLSPETRIKLHQAMQQAFAKGSAHHA